MSSSALRSKAVLAAIGAAMAASAAFAAAPSAVADPNTTACQPGQIVIDGQCVAQPPQTGSAQTPPSNHSSDNGHH